MGAVRLFRSQPPRTPASATSPDPVENAWKIHAALVDWTGKVDSKASFALALESAVLGGIVTLTTGDRPLAGLIGRLPLALFWSGIAALVVAVLTVMVVVRPRVRGKEAKRERRDNFIYFGHLRHWKPADLQTALEQRDILPVLSRQLVAMSMIAWHKHRWLQWSLTLAVIGTGLVAAAGAVDGISTAR